jgi:hypothetical protein
VIVRRQDLTLPPHPNEGLATSLPSYCVILILIAATLWVIETLALALKNRREGNRRRLAFPPDARVGPHALAYKQRILIAKRGDKQCEQWRAWVAAMVVQRKIRCNNSCRRAVGSAHSGTGRQ